MVKAFSIIFLALVLFWSSPLYAATEFDSDSNGKIDDTYVQQYARIQLSVVPDDSTLVVGDTSQGFRVPANMNGATLTAVGAQVDTASSANTPTFKVEKFHLSAPGTLDAAVQMLSTNLTVDPGEYDSSTAETQAAISAVAGAATVATGDIIKAACVTSAGTGTKGGVVSLQFLLP